jgi:hypothetical protein
MDLPSDPVHGKAELGEGGESIFEASRFTWNFYVAKQGFSDQMFLVRTSDFKAPIYSEMRLDASHYPRGDVWEARVFSYLKNRGYRRITFRHGSYVHENISLAPLSEQK